MCIESTGQESTANEKEVSKMMSIQELGRKRISNQPINTNLQFNSSQQTQHTQEGNYQQNQEFVRNKPSKKRGEQADSRPIQVTIKEVIGIKEMKVERFSDKEVRQLEQTVNQVLIKAIQNITR